mgnify:CR=1 FL=1
MASAVIASACGQRLGGSKGLLGPCLQQSSPMCCVWAARGRAAGPQPAPAAALSSGAGRLQPLPQRRRLLRAAAASSGDDGVNSLQLDTAASNFAKGEAAEEVESAGCRSS